MPWRCTIRSRVLWWGIFRPVLHWWCRKSALAHAPTPVAEEGSLLAWKHVVRERLQRHQDKLDGGPRSSPSWPGAACATSGWWAIVREARLPGRLDASNRPCRYFGLFCADFVCLGGGEGLEGVENGVFVAPSICRRRCACSDTFSVRTAYPPGHCTTEGQLFGTHERPEGHLLDRGKPRELD
jgi:hypothetical protein